MAGRGVVQALRPARLISSLWKSSALRAAAALGVSGIALALGNLMLARVLPTGEFARFALFFAIAQIGMNIGPFGADVVMTRRRFHPGPALHRQVLYTSAAVGFVLLVASKLLYPLDNTLLAILFATVAAGGVKVVATTHYRGLERYGAALLLTMSTNIALLAASSVAYAMHAQSALLPAGTMAASVAITAWLGWRAVSGEEGAGKESPAYPVGEAWAAVSFIGAGMLLSSLERLITPALLGLSALATFTLLATVAGSPFQMLHQGIGYTLVPGLRNAANRTTRRRVLVHEGIVALAACAAAGVVVWWLTPFVFHTVLTDRYEVSWALVLAVICLGCVKVLGSIAAAAVNALGSAIDLARMSLAGWLAIAVAAAGAWLGSRWGLSGLVYGVGAGWLVRALIVSSLAVRHLLGSGEGATVASRPEQA